MADDLFDDLPDITPKGTIEHTLPHVFVHSDKPLVLVMQHAGTAGNPAFASAYPAYDSKRSLLLARGDREGARELFHGLCADTVVIGWKNCNAKDGSPLTYSPAIARKLFASICARGGEDELGSAFLRAQIADNFRDSPEAIAASLGK